MNTKLELRIKVLSIFVVLALFFVLLPTTTVHAAPKSVTLGEFVATLSKTDSSQLIGVYVKNTLAAKVVQQSYSTYVSGSSRTLTQFGIASDYGSIGLLAHNYLSGSAFFNMRSGTEIFLVYGDGSTKKYKVTGIKKYQAVNPTDPYSDFIDLNNPGGVLSSDDVINETYGSGALVFQTCISKDGNSLWGRLFVIATETD